MKNKDSNFVSAVVYIHNDEKNIEQFFRGLIEVFSSNFNEYEIVCVDDNSTDNSVSIVKNVLKQSKSESTVNLISLSFFHGVELAMNAGIDMSIGDFVFEFDCIKVDFNWNMVMQVYRKELEGFDITSAAPKLKGRWGSKIFYGLLRLGNKDISDLQTESFRVVSRRAINRVKAMSIATPFRQIAYASSGLKLASISFEPYGINYSLNSSYRRNLAIHSILMFTSICENIAIIFSALTAMWGSIQIIRREKYGENKIILAVVFLMVSIVIKYLKIINELIFKKQNYIIGGVEKINNSKL